MNVQTFLLLNITKLVENKKILDSIPIFFIIKNFGNENELAQTKWCGKNSFPTTQLRCGKKKVWVRGKWQQLWLGVGGTVGW